jgi:hypothetical protein
MKRNYTVTEATMPRRVHVKVQSVRHVHLEQDHSAPMSLGQQIDELLLRESEEGRFPNRLSLEINPPEEPDCHRMED